MRFFVCEVDKGSHTLFTNAEKNQEFISFIICKYSSVLVSSHYNITEVNMKSSDSQ